MNRRTVVLLALAAAVLLAGQIDRELLPPDDLREAEVAREMWEGGSLFVPRLAGLPFVEKPPGFSAVVAAAYAAAGGPSALVARAVSAAFALAAVAAVFLLGRRMAGPEQGAWAAALLAFSARFCRTAHEVLLDNALAAASAFALLALWIALEAGEERTRGRAWAGFAFALGVAFMVKGAVVPVLFGACLLGLLAVTGRWGALWEALRPLPLLAFLLPVLAWLLPFAREGGPGLLREFLVDNQWGRATEGYRSNVRPSWFYLGAVWVQFAPGSLLLPAAAAAAWRARRDAGDRAAAFLLGFGAGSLVLLSLPVAKDSVYMLPAFPALALLAARGLRGALDAAGTGGGAARAAVGVACLLCAAAAIVATKALGGGWGAFAAEIAAASAIGTAGAVLLRRGEARAAACAWAGLVAAAWILLFTGPVAAAEVARCSIRRPVEAVLAVAGDREALLYNPDDGLRGAAGFYRNRTAVEVGDPVALLDRLARDPRLVAVVRGPPEAVLRLAAVAKGLGRVIVEEARAGTSGRVALALIRVDPEKATLR